jgi:polysaccharide export outer membrane protein
MVADAPAVATAPNDNHYTLGVGDVIEIRVFNRPQLSRDSVRVEDSGMIRMPLIKEPIQAACHTEEELAREIASQYLKYLRNPQVEIFIKEYQSQPVALIGAVNSPGRFQLRRRVRLLELLSFAGGPAERAGNSIQIVHDQNASICDASASPNSAEIGDARLVSYNLSKTLRGIDQSNPYVQPGDIITIAEAEQAFILGNVLKPSPISLKEATTVSHAIAMAGGTLPGSNKEKIRIIRQAPGSTEKTEIAVDLKAINRRQAEDILLQGGDIVEVPGATGIQSFMKDLMRTVVPTLSQYPVRIIPIGGIR